MFLPSPITMACGIEDFPEPLTPVIKLTRGPGVHSNFPCVMKLDNSILQIHPSSYCNFPVESVSREVLGGGVEFPFVVRLFSSNLFFFVGTEGELLPENSSIILFRADIFRFLDMFSKLDFLIFVFRSDFPPCFDKFYKSLLFSLLYCTHLPFEDLDYKT